MKPKITIKQIKPLPDAIFEVTIADPPARAGGSGDETVHTVHVEDEYMKANEYDALLEDPSDYAVRTYMPRIYGALESLKTLPSLRSMLLGYG